MGIKYIYILSTNDDRFVFHNVRELVEKVNEISCYKLNQNKITNYYAGRIKNPKSIYRQINRLRI